MRWILPVLALIVLMPVSNSAQTNAKTDAGLPKEAKAQRSYAEGQAWLKQHDYPAALSSFKKADKEDGGHCAACRKMIIDLGEKTADYKSAEAAAEEEIEVAKAPLEQADAHMQRGILLLHEGEAKNKEDAFAEADKDFKAALASEPKYSSAYYGDGLALGHLKQDDAAKQSSNSLYNLNPSQEPSMGGRCAISNGPNWCVRIWLRRLPRRRWTASTFHSTT